MGESYLESNLLVRVIWRVSWTIASGQVSGKLFGKLFVVESFLLQNYLECCLVSCSESYLCAVGFYVCGLLCVCAQRK